MLIILFFFISLVQDNIFKNERNNNQRGEDKKGLKEILFICHKKYTGKTQHGFPHYIRDEWELFDEKNNKSYKYADTVLFLAYRENKLAGRIMGIVNRRYNEIHNENHGRFCFMECYKDQEVVHALINKVEIWAKEKAMTKLVGPLGFSDKGSHRGFRIEGFDYPKFIVCPTNDSYLPEMITKEGYEKNRDLVNYIADVPKDLPEIYKKILSRVSINNEYRIIEFSTKKELYKYIIPVLDLMNKTFEEIYGFVPLDDQEKKEIAARYMMILDPKFIKVVEAPDGLIGFAVGIPDISNAIRKSKGKTLAFRNFQNTFGIKKI